ncbi:hypothetical protein MNBD_GAMMA02-299 [hydrothermal vent metagenome]|uniref:Peptidase M48 domain-containing protein n=1 Tax=hydrothermal vent metagenome TaxID=652676 RepID=A0A3B0WBS7_9ZZZZ
MRKVNIKNIHHSQFYYALSVLLLLSCSSLAAKQTDKINSALLENAQLQQQKLIDAHGLSQHSDWQKRCLEMITTLELKRFEHCLILKASFANAYSLAHGSVILTEGLLQNINNDDQLAHILAHEHAHLNLSHHQQAQKMVKNPPKLFTKARIKKFYRKIEREADQAADDTLMKQQRDRLQIHHYLLRIEQNTEEYSNDHQKLKHRIQRNNLPVEVIETFWANE